MPSCKDDLQGQMVRNYRESLVFDKSVMAKYFKKNPLYQQHVKGGYVTGKGEGKVEQDTQYFQ